MLFAASPATPTSDMIRYKPEWLTSGAAYDRVNIKLLIVDLHYDVGYEFVGTEATIVCCEKTCRGTKKY